ncbi:MAG TPA: OsmC family protein [Ignavibacteriaceae bacterium]|nr:OsmC family protein [Ignavibacteriaceae bacterium]
MVIKKAFIKQLRGITLAGKSDSGHWVMMDGSEDFGGSRAACSPKELLLIALGGCTANDVIPILKKKRAKLDGFEINLSGEEAAEHPKVFTKIHIEYILYGRNIQAKDVERAIELSKTKYCSVSSMLIKSVELTHSYKIINSEENIKEVETEV